jgi:transketolase N-terminal domain/subunit
MQEAFRASPEIVFFAPLPTYTRDMSLNVEVLARAANEARGLAMDAVHASKSGHLGLPLGCAEIGAVLYGHELKYNPEQPRWIGRDYFILSAGHGSMMLYAWLHLSGHDVPMERSSASASYTARRLGTRSTSRPLVWNARPARSDRA